VQAHALATGAGGRPAACARRCWVVGGAVLVQAAGPLLLLAILWKPDDRTCGGGFLKKNFETYSYL